MTDGPTGAGTDRDRTGSGFRVAVREIREAAFRAVVAAGASSGEAATTADLVVLGEVLDGAGILALADELDRVPRGRHPVTCSGDPLLVLHDPARRGLLLLGPSAADLAAAGARPVLLPGAWTPSVEWILVSAAARTGTPLLATRIRADGSPGACALATADSTVYRAPRPGALGPQHTVDASGQHDAGRPGEGILLSRWNGDPRTLELPPARTTAHHHECFATVMTHGLRVDPGPWATVYGASRRYLVPEHP
ncbi:MULTISPECIES: hypothetical protein [unclassified Streptomyces]|uniref:hypothetical protein n=1 Tax=unclassified Streptomyces TaxID=2593676 RepID=UPI002E1B4E51|nr:hypothetical protein OG217_01650 [Streptomyces sp. NBC_01023]